MESARRLRRLKRKQDPLAVIVAQLRRNAKKRGLECSLVKADLLPAPVYCPVLNLKLDYLHTAGGLKRPDNAASVDRTDCSKGYVRGNVAILSARANRLKSDGTAEEIRRVWEYLVKIRKG